VNAFPPPQPPPQQPSSPQPPGHGPPKKSGNGCLIALGIVGGIFLFAGLVVAFFIYRFANSPDGKKIVSAVASISEAANAPGTKELRALGCKKAAVIDVGQLQAIADTFVDAGTAETGGHSRIAVTCTTSRGAMAPTCEQVAATYVGAVGRVSAPFLAVVGPNGGPAECQQEYSEEGVRLEGTRHP
jgi:hypothetical protein